MVTSTLQKTSSILVVLGLAACGDGTASTGAAKDSTTPASTSAAPAKSSATTATSAPTPSATASQAAATPSASASVATSASAAPSVVTTGGTGPAKGPQAGKPWQVVASAEAESGYHCNSEYPNKFRTSGGTNVTYPDPNPKGGCAGNSVVVSIPIVPTAAGPGTVTGTLSYGICDDSKTNCKTLKKEMTLSFTAAP